MTLRERVAEVQPENSNSIYGGGVYCCPMHYEYLHSDALTACSERLVTEEDCIACWNREYKEATT